jgi:hypothetical protein
VPSLQRKQISSCPEKIKVQAHIAHEGQLRLGRRQSLLGSSQVALPYLDFRQRNLAIKMGRVLSLQTYCIWSVCVLVFRCLDQFTYLRQFSPSHAPFFGVHGNLGRMLSRKDLDIPVPGKRDHICTLLSERKRNIGFLHGLCGIR